MEESDSSQQPKRCPCGFWGSPQTSGLCSKCYKATVQEKSQEGLDAKSELIRNRQSAYTSHDSVGATSTSYLQTSRNPQSASSMEKAEELFRQAVKNTANVENNSPKLAKEETVANNTPDSHNVEKSAVASTSDSAQSKGASDNNTDAANSQAKDLATTSANSDNCASNKDNVVNIVKDSSSGSSKDTSAVDAKNPVLEILSPEKRGVKRDRSEVDSDTASSTPEKVGTKNKKRCAVCRCKLELAQRTIGRCRCDNVYCSLHRLPELHNCDFDHKEDGRREAREKMVKPTRHLGNTFKRLDSDS